MSCCPAHTWRPCTPRPSCIKRSPIAAPDIHLIFVLFQNTFVVEHSVAKSEHIKPHCHQY